MQSFDRLDHFAGSAGPYPAPTRYAQASSIGYDNPPHLPTVSVRLLSSFPFR